jgi:hypothetical protein
MLYIRLLSIVVLALHFSITSSGQQATNGRYIFFLHNKFIEEHEVWEKHPSYGQSAYKEITDRFKKDGFIVLSEKRRAGTDPKNYAGPVAAQIDSLLHTGVAPSNITIVGTSKGGYIAQYVSDISRNPALNFVFIGSSFQDDMKDEPDIKLYGRVLSIIEASDTGQIALSKQLRFKESDIKKFKEITLHTGLHHGFLFKALDAWILPTEKWARSGAIFN